MTNKGNTVTCIFVHGWAMNSAVWDSCIKPLPDWINVVMVDLPGHGTMAEVTASSLDDYVHTLISLAHKPVVWVGWSLGGLAVLRLAELFPQRVAAALLVATNPCFVRREDWPDAVDKKIFDQFACDLKADQIKTIRRFLALQVKGSVDMKPVLRHLQQSIESRGSASQQALSVGLKLLLDSDLTPSLKNIEPPLHWLLGAKDALVPVSLADVLLRQFEQQSVTVLPQASHAPFISHTDEFVRQLIKIAELQREQLR